MDRMTKKITKLINNKSNRINYNSSNYNIRYNN